MVCLAKVLTINVQKGGVGKSTTVHELASNLHNKGYKVLAIDLDPQQNLSRFSGAPLTGWFTIYDILKGTGDWDDAIHNIDPEMGIVNYDVCTCHEKLFDADKEFSDWEDVYRLTDAIKEIRDEYDFIVIDTPPKMGVLPDMALTAADYVIIPVEASAAGIQGIGQAVAKIEKITHPERGINKNLKVAGMLLTKYTGRTKLEKSIKAQLESVAERSNTKIFETTIRESVSVKEAQAFKTSLLQHAPKSKPCEDYMNFTEELLKEIENNG